VVISASNTPRPIANTLVLDGEIHSYGSGDFAGGSLIINNGGRPVTIGENLFAGGNLLVAGQPLPMDMQLGEKSAAQGGDEPAVRIFLSGHQAADRRHCDDNLFLDFTERTLLADWVVPDGAEAYDVDFNWYGPGQMLPAGTLPCDGLYVARQGTARP
jgi:hypothetical protein